MLGIQVKIKFKNFEGSGLIVGENEKDQERHKEKC
jgi:hypothetical protein